MTPSDDSSPQPGNSQMTAQKHVLVIDDDTEITESLRHALKAAGYAVTIAQDGNQGVAIAETKNPDLLILDMMMPKRSGFLVLERLRQNQENPVPVIMITGNEGNRHRAYAELLGVNDYIYKPFTMDRLLKSVNGLIGPAE